MQMFFKVFSGLLFALFGFLEPTFHFAYILLFAIIADCVSAYDLSRRLAKLHPDVVKGKFQSNFALKMLKTFSQVYIVVVLLFMVDNHILKDVYDFHLSNIAAAVFVLIQVWSILENLSSGNGAKWAKVLQKVMVDKTERHFKIDISTNKKRGNEKPVI